MSAAESSLHEATALLTLVDPEQTSQERKPRRQIHVRLRTAFRRRPQICSNGYNHITSAVAPICKRCKAISGRSVALPIRFSINKSTSELQQSQCRMCRLLGHYLLVRAADYPNHGLPLQSPDSISGSNKVECFRVQTLSDHLDWRSTAGLLKSHETTQLVVYKTERNDVSKAINCVHPPKLNLKLIRNWVANCQSQHMHQCALHPWGDLKDLKVIDCVREEIVRAPAKCRYIALSYVWGKGNPQIPTCETLLGAPKTIKDAIKLTKDLGYQYLWVDRYCISQMDARTKHVQIAQMGNIYASAHLTIIATLGNNPHYGLPGVSYNSRARKSEEMESYTVAVLPQAHDIERIKQSTWSKRAWTLQESVLSRRRLILTERQAIFICNTGAFFESKLDSQVVADTFWRVGWLPPRYKKDPMETATTYLTEYSKRDLSYDTDALNAIIGALNTLNESCIYHVWGVPFRHVESPTSSSITITESTATIGKLHLTFRGSGIQLLWSHEKPARRRRGFPSWSSLGWAGELSSENELLALRPQQTWLRTKSGRHDLFDVIPRPDALPESIAQQLELHGETCSVLLANDGGVILPYNDQIYYNLPVSWSAKPSSQDQGTDALPGLKALLVRRPSGANRDRILILKPSDTNGWYERIGLSAMWTFYEDWLHSVTWLDGDLQPLNNTPAVSESLKTIVDTTYHKACWLTHFSSEVVTLV